MSKYVRRRNVIKAIIAAPFILAVTSAESHAVDWRTYPNCNAPAIPLESHSWWHQAGEQYPRHVHIAACIPNARDTTGKIVSFSGSQNFTTRVMAFNNPGTITWARDGYEDTELSKVTMEVRCQPQAGILAECRYPVDLLLDANVASSGGLHELRMSPNVVYDDLGTRQFTTLNFQVYLKNGKTPNNYRPTPNPIARSWYTGFGYANVSVNYADFFTNINQTIPLVGGVVPLKVSHSNGTFRRTSYLFLDPDFHAYPESHENPAADPSGKTKLLYKKPGLFKGTYYWDTRSLTNGVHTLYLQTEDEGPNGVHAGALKLLFNVHN